MDLSGEIIRAATSVSRQLAYVIATKSDADLNDNDINTFAESIYNINKFAFNANVGRIVLSCDGDKTSRPRELVEARERSSAPALNRLLKQNANPKGILKIKRSDTFIYCLNPSYI